MSKIEQCKAWLAAGKMHISPRELAALVGGNPYSYNISAREGHLGLQYVFAGNRLKISTASVLKYLTGDLDMYKD